MQTILNIYLSFVIANIFFVKNSFVKDIIGLIVSHTHKQGEIKEEKKPAFFKVLVWLIVLTGPCSILVLDKAYKMK